MQDRPERRTVRAGLFAVLRICVTNVTAEVTFGIFLKIAISDMIDTEQKDADSIRLSVEKLDLAP